MAAAAAAVLHVSESFGGGVRAAIKDYVRNTPECSHHLLFAPRTNAPLGESDLFGFLNVLELPNGHIARVAAVRRAAGELSPSVIHAHSSYAGVYVRLALRSGKNQRIVYTPHCYAFERRDIPRIVRGSLRFTEWLLSSNTDVFAGCSRRETTLSRWPLSQAATIFVPNVAGFDQEPRGSMPERQARLTVAGAGRLDPQKDPEFFLAAIRSLRECGIDVDAVWIGAGSSSVQSALLSGGIRVTGWLRREDVLNELSQADIYLHTAAWEGFPITVLEATTLGVATVVRRIRAFDGVTLPATIARPQELAERWHEFCSAESRSDLIANMRAALVDFDDVAQREALRKAWGVQLSPVE